MGLASNAGCLVCLMALCGHGMWCYHTDSTSVPEGTCLILIREGISLFTKTLAEVSSSVLLHRGPSFWDVNYWGTQSHNSKPPVSPRPSSVHCQDPSAWACARSWAPQPECREDLGLFSCVGIHRQTGSLNTRGLQNGTITVSEGSTLKVAILFISLY